MSPTSYQTAPPRGVSERLAACRGTFPLAEPPARNAASGTVRAHGDGEAARRPHRIGTGDGGRHGGPRPAARRGAGPRPVPRSAPRTVEPGRERRGRGDARGPAHVHGLLVVIAH